MKAYPVRLYINGIQRGGNATIAEIADSVEQASAQVKADMESRGYTVEVTIWNLPRWANAPTEETVVADCTK